MRICHILGVPPSNPGSQTPALLPQVQDSSPTLFQAHPFLRPRIPASVLLPQTQELTPQPSSADQGLYLRVERVVIICVIVVITGV